MEIKEINHIILVITNVKTALINENSIQLKTLSNQVIHRACSVQDQGSLTLSIIIYALGKIIERKDNKRIKNWGFFVKKFSSLLDLSIKSLRDNNMRAYESYLLRARKTLETVSPSLKPYIQQVIKKSCINKAGKMHEHGLSLGHTARLLGVSEWDLVSYTGQKRFETPITLDVKKRAKLAMEFLS